MPDETVSHIVTTSKHSERERNDYSHENNLRTPQTSQGEATQHGWSTQKASEHRHGEPQDREGQCKGAEGVSEER
jgi:hypothetical protein